MPTITIARTTEVPPAPVGTLHAGAAEVDITPPAGIPLAGYSTIGKVARGTCGHLFARALVLDGEASERVAFCFVDLQGATRYLLERAAERLAGTAGVGPSRLVLVGTHTHTGPGWTFGNGLYDQFAQVEAGFDRGLADWLAGRIAQAVEDAARARRPARLAVRSAPAWGFSRNRSWPAFLRNPEAARWDSAGLPGAGAPDHLCPEQRSIDPRVTTISLFDAADGAPLAAFAAFGCHATTRGPHWPYYDPDWAGQAQRRARATLEERFPGARPVVAVAASAAGDVNGLLCELPPDSGEDFDLARHVGDGVAAAIVTAVQSSAAEARSVPIRVRFTEPAVNDRSVGGDPTTTLAEEWCFGAPTLVGSEEGRTGVPPLFAREGMTSALWFPPGHPQRPKAPALGPLQALLAGLLALRPSAALPMHLVQLGAHRIATVPGEPTTVAAWRIEQALRALPGVAQTCVLGYAADYGGYFTTAEEFSAQHYEGSSMLFGRNAAAHVRARLVALATSPATPLAPTVTFETGPLRSRYRPGDKCGPVPAQPAVARQGPVITASWTMEAGSRVAFSQGPWVGFDERVGGAWRPLVWLGRPVDDVNAPITVERLRKLGPVPPGGTPTERWQARWRIPPEVAPGTVLRVSVASRDQSPGFALAVPPA